MRIGSGIAVETPK